MKNFQDLELWRRSHQFTLAIYSVTRHFPDDERYGLTSQLRRAASSIPTNIAEGCGRSSERELARFLDIAMGSAKEVEYLIILARDLSLLDQSRSAGYLDEIVAIQRMGSGLLRRIRNTNREIREDEEPYTTSE